MKSYSNLSLTIKDHIGSDLRKHPFNPPHTHTLEDRLYKTNRSTAVITKLGSEASTKLSPVKLCFRNF